MEFGLVVRGPPPAEATNGESGKTYVVIRGTDQQARTC